MLTPIVIAQRLPVLWMEAAGLSKGRSESGRMVAEKVAAMSEGIVAANMEMHRLWWQSILAMSQGLTPPSAISMTKSVTAAAFQPTAKRLRSNVKRLNRR
jgi:hypothetical protein